MSNKENAFQRFRKALAQMNPGTIASDATSRSIAVRFGEEDGREVGYIYHKERVEASLSAIPEKFWPTYHEAYQKAREQELIRKEEAAKPNPKRAKAAQGILWGLNPTDFVSDQAPESPIVEGETATSKSEGYEKAEFPDETPYGQNTPVLKSSNSRNYRQRDKTSFRVRSWAEVSDGVMYITPWNVEVGADMKLRVSKSSLFDAKSRPGGTVSLGVQVQSDGTAAIFVDPASYYRFERRGHTFGNSDNEYFSVSRVVHKGKEFTVLPEELRQRVVEDLKVGDTAYVTPWSVWETERGAVLPNSAAISQKRFGTAELKVGVDEQGTHVDYRGLGENPDVRRYRGEFASGSKAYRRVTSLTYSDGRTKTFGLPELEAPKLRGTPEGPDLSL